MSTTSASFDALKSTVIGGSTLAVAAFFAYGFALKYHCQAISPRCTARPKDTVYNRRSSNNAWVGWVKEVLNLDYENMLNGVPGTGTKGNGTEGTLLNINLDGIVFLRFNALCLRVALLASILSIGIILPVNWTANPDYTESSYNRTTLANIPALAENIPNVSAMDLARPKLLMRNLGINLIADLPLQFRLYAIVFCCWIVTYYLCIEIGNEWHDNLELRRRYYLEADHHRRSKERLTREKKQSGELGEKRDPWIPNPDHSTTIPNIELYSLIVGGIPCIPQQVLTEKNIFLSLKDTEQQLTDWQLSVTTAFFDRCCPNQPGFSSSVAAITVLPGSRQLARAWSRWYSAAAALRRLRFIRSSIADRLFEKVGNDCDVLNAKPRRVCASQGADSSIVTLSHQGKRNIFKDENGSTRMLVSQLSSLPNEEIASQLHELNDAIETQLLEALEYGPEQTAVYEREYALAAAGCAPTGWGNEIMKYKNMEELLEMECGALEAVKEANDSLRKMQSRLASSEALDESDKVKIAFVDRKGSEVKPDNKNNEFFLDDSAGGEEFPIKSSKQHTSSLTSRKRYNIAPSLVEQSLNETGPRSRSKIKIISEQISRGSLNTSHVGNWNIRGLTWKSFGDCLARNFKAIFIDRVKRVFNSFYRESTFAVVTFTNRQAALAARQCLADGRGTLTWHELEDVPVPPLSDAPICDFYGTRNLFRPVTLSLPRPQQMLRQWCKNFLLVLINLFYTVPLTFISTATNLSNESWASLFPNSSMATNHSSSLDGIIYAFLYSLFISICPYMFKLIANFGSISSSVSRAELSAMQYYWIFVLLTSFTGVTIANTIVAAWASNQLTPSLTAIVKAVADTIPVSISFNWINTIFLRTTMTLPVFYLLQLNTFLFMWLRCNCLGRMMMGGGAGGDLPYRAYIDAGTTLLCVVTLSFAAPLVAPFAVMFFLVSEPVWRQTLLYVYQPTYDGGGFRWPFISDMCFSSMILGQVLLAFMISLKRTVGPALAAGITVIPSIMFRKLMHRQYYRKYKDIALLQASYLDLWDTSARTTEEREEFRKFLVDCHKAAYIPVCISGSETAILTTEPATVIMTDVESKESNNLFTLHDSETCPETCLPLKQRVTLRSTKENSCLHNSA